MQMQLKINEMVKSNFKAVYRSWDVIVQFAYASIIHQGTEV